MGKLLCAIGLALLLVCLPSCSRMSAERDRRTALDEGLTESQVVDLYGNPDEIFGPIVNAYNESVVIWYYHAKGSWIQSNSVWIYMIDRKYLKSTPPGEWPIDSTAIYGTRFRK